MDVLFSVFVSSKTMDLESPAAVNGLLRSIAAGDGEAVVIGVNEMAMYEDVDVVVMGS